MLLIIHVLIALSSLLLSGWALGSPDVRKIKASYALVGATLFSGTILVISTSASLTSACLSGLAYSAAVSAMLITANIRLARAEQNR